MKFRSLIKGFHHDWRVDRILQLLFKRLWYFKYGLLSLVLVSALRAEVLWVLNVVINHFSLCLCLGLNDLFKSMFPDSEIAKWIILVSKTKCECLINCRLVSFFKDDLLKLINVSPYCVILYDESMRKIQQDGQMDLQVRYWDDNETGLPKIFWFKTSELPECHKSQHCFICIFGEIVASQVKSNFISDIINNDKKYNFQ